MKRALILAALAGAPRTAEAAGFAVAEQSPVAAATAGAGTARAEDPSAGWYNPAALADGGGWRAGLGLTLAVPSVDAADPAGMWASETEPNVLTPPHLYLSRAWHRYAAGVAVNVPFGAGVTWPSDWRGRHEIVESRLQVFRVAPFFAYGYHDLRASVGVHVDLGTLDVARRLDFVDTEGDVALALSGAGFGVDAALWWRASAGLDVGLSYKSRSTLAMEGDADFTAPDAFAYKLSDQGVSAEVKLPDRFAFGLHYRATPRLTLLGDVEVFLWGRYDRLVLDFDEEQTPDVINETDWESTIAVRAGAEYTLGRRVTARAGLFHDPSPAPASTLAPTSPDSTRTGVTVGAGVALSRTLSMDFFYEYLHLAERSYEGEEHLTATYGGDAHLFGVGMRWTR